MRDADAVFLCDLAGRIFHNATPAMGFDQGDTDQLYRIARTASPSLLAHAEALNAAGLFDNDAQFARIKAKLRAMDAVRGGV